MSSFKIHNSLISHMLEIQTLTTIIKSNLDNNDEPDVNIINEEYDSLEVTMNGGSLYVLGGNLHFVNTLGTITKLTG